MRKYDFSVDCVRALVYPVSSPNEAWEEIADSLPEGDLAILLYPCDGADFGALSIDKYSNQPREPYLLLAALSCFFNRVRAYPDMTLEIKISDNIYDLLIRNEKYSFSVNVGKCKIEYSKTFNFSDKTQINIHVINSGAAIGVTVCNDSEFFDVERLKLLHSRFPSVDAVSAISYSEDEGVVIRSVGTAPYYDVVSASLSALMDEGVKIKETALIIALNGCELRAELRGNTLTLYPNIKYIS